MRYLGQRKGAVLIIVLGVLAVLALLAITFSTLQATERQVAHNYLDTVRAKLLAQSGVQDAEAKLREYFPFRYFNSVDPRAPKPWKYWGADITEKNEPPANDLLENALNPSFAIEADSKNVAENPQNPTDSNFTPKKVTIEGKDHGLSGYQGGTYAMHGDQYVLRVSDMSGRLYVNDGVDGTIGGNKNSTSCNLKRILNELGNVLSKPKIGDKIVDNRPPEGYRSMQDLLKALGYDESLFNSIKNYLTVYAWVDPNVVNPVPLGAGAAGGGGSAILSLYDGSTGIKYERGTPPVYRSGSTIQGVDSKGNPLDIGLNMMTGPGQYKRNDIRVYGLDSLNPQYIEVVARAPVNINAASEEVLIALVTGLQGFFLTDRRRNNPRWQGDLYLSFKHMLLYEPPPVPDGPSKGDEVGYLMTTFPIVNTTGTGTPGISARTLAREIIACRNGDLGQFANYNPDPTKGGKWFGGPFKSWHQFNAFVDFLARPKGPDGAGFLIDTRADMYKDYDEEGVDAVGYGTLVDSQIQREYGNQAIADVLKANFNPNCHLNELNPDANLFQAVDKTDLIIHSTEFCFMPTGYFEVESLGRILRPTAAGTLDAYAGDNNIAAQARVTATFKIYDMYRESTQKQFYAGTCAPQSSQWGTNNDKSIELGPEPDNGFFQGNLADDGKNVPDNEWDGYLALPTMGGVFGGGHGAAPKQPNTLVNTMSLGQAPHQQSAFHVHFTLDHDAHQHPVDPTEIASRGRVAGVSETFNYGDYVDGTGVLPIGGPYNPTKATPNYHRLAKSYRLNPDPTTGTISGLSLQAFAPSDLRIDGAYVERHSAPAYYNLKGGVGLWDFDNTAPSKGLISFWWKPSYAPELTGKIRTMWDMGRYHDSCGANVNIWPFALWYYPSHYNVAQSEASPWGSGLGPKYWSNNMGKFEPSSLCFGSKQWHGSSSGNPDPAHEFGRMTKCLNHMDHKGNSCYNVAPNPLQAHKWVNSSLFWDLSTYNDTSGEIDCHLYTNGTETYSLHPQKYYNYSKMTGFTTGHSKISMFNKHDGGAFNHMRLGATSRISDAAKANASQDTANGNGAYKGNYSGDHTVDEVYVWLAGTGRPDALWDAGRYYKPVAGGTGGAAQEGRFTSQVLTKMVPYTPRVLAPPSSVAAPGGTGTAGGSMTVEPPTLRILGMSWTWYGEKPDEKATPLATWDGVRLLYDYNKDGTNRVAKGPPLEVKVGAGIEDGTGTYGPYYDDGFSAVMNSKSRTPVIQDPKQLKYFVQIEIPAAGKPVLLATPVIDDVTIFWDDNQSHLLSYVFDNRSF